MDERILQIEKLAHELRRLVYGAGGQSISLQMNQRELAEVGKKCLTAIKEYKDWYKESFGDLFEGGDVNND